MIDHILKTSPIPNLLEKLAGLDQPGGDARLKRIVQRIVADLFATIEEFDVTPAEFWSAASYLAAIGQEHEEGLLAAGLGFEHFLDLRLDEKERVGGGAPGPGPRNRRGAVHARPGPRHGRQPGAARDRGRVARQHQGRLLHLRHIADAL